MRFALRGRRVLLTGASSGIGRELASVLAGAGARLVVSARREPRLAELAQEIAARGLDQPTVLAADLSRRGEARELASRAQEALGGVDVLVNNAGVGVGASQWAGGDRDEPREVFETNYWSPLALTSALVSPMRERGSGAVVNVTSLAQVMPWGGLGHYSSSKAALAVATETLRLELVGTGVHVLEVIPGPTDTAVMGESRLLPGFTQATKRAPLGDPAELARLAVQALECRRSRLVYPRALRAAYVLPGVVRAVLPLMAARTESQADDPRVVRSGSLGDEEARAAREEWERSAGGRR